MDSKTLKSNPKRRSTSPKRNVAELKHIIVIFEHPDDKEDSAIFGTFFCEYGTISREEIEMVQLWSKTPTSVFLDFETEVTKYDATAKRMVSTVCSVPKETRIAHALLLRRFGIECGILQKSRPRMCHSPGHLTEKLDFPRAKPFVRIDIDHTPLPNGPIKTITVNKMVR